MSTVLVTGGTGFVGTHAIAQLLEAGHDVRTTVRSLKRQNDVERMLATAGAPHTERVSYFEADLTSDDGWATATRGADYVLHVASPFPSERPKTEDELIIPARDGALRVLRSARDAGVRRVVLTSSCAAVTYGHPRTDRLFAEDDWTELTGPGVSAYIRSKTVAERTAWDFIDAEGADLELSVINPVGIFGPALGPDFASSLLIIKTMLDGGMRTAPPLWTQVVDVRDVVDAHLKAMTSPIAAGQRYIALAGEPLSFARIGQILHARLAGQAAEAPTRAAPAWLITVLARFNPRLQELVPQLNNVRTASNAKIRKELGWTPRSNEEAVTSSAESLLRLGLAGR